MPIHTADAHRDNAFVQRQTGLLFNLPVPDPAIAQLPAGISLCMIVKNEERFLAECLESLKDVVDEINIVDTGSTDRTVEIARGYGAKIEFREWRSDFGWARNESLAMATRRWVIVLDADEELEPESRALLRSLRTVPADTTCVYVDIVNLIDDQTGVATMSHRLLRVFPNSPRMRFKGAIHESLALDEGGNGMAGVVSPLRILHKGYTTEMLRDRDKDARNRPLVVAAYEENSDDLFAMFNFGNAAICSGDTAVGVACLERMLDIAPSTKIYFPLSYVMLGQTYSETLGDPEKAIATIDRGLESFPHDAGLLFTKGQVLAKQGKTDAARELYQQALALREAMVQTAMTDDEIFEWKIFAALAGSYERDGNYDDAVVWMEKAVANKPAAAYLQRAKAHMLERIGRQYEAETTYRRMVALDARAGRGELVNYLLRRGRFAEALAIIENEMVDEVGVVNLAALNVAAANAAIATQSNDPVPFLLAALRRHPGCGTALALYEKLLSERGDAAALAAMHDGELAADCVIAEDYYRRSFRLLAIERATDARDAAERGLALDPAHDGLRFNLAIACLRLGDARRAEAEFARVATGDVEVVAAAMQSLAQLLLERGDVAAAADALERWLAHVPDDAQAVVRAAKLLASLDARDAARAMLAAHVGVGKTVALELATMYLQDGDFAAAGRVAETALS